MKPWIIDISKHEEGYEAICESLPDVAEYGDTPEEAFWLMVDAIVTTLEWFGKERLEC